MARSKASSLLQDERRISSVLSDEADGKTALGEEAGANAGSRLLSDEDASGALEDGKDAPARTGASRLTRAGVVRLVRRGRAVFEDAATDGLEEDDGAHVAGSARDSATDTAAQLRAARKKKAKEASGQGIKEASSQGVKEAREQGTKAARKQGSKAKSRAAGARGKAGAPKEASARAARGAIGAGARASEAPAAAIASRNAAGAGAKAASGGSALAGAGAVAVAMGLVAVAVIAVLTMIMVTSSLVTLSQESTKAQGGGAERIVAVAKAEYDRGEADGTHNAGGSKYWGWCGYKERIEWCCCFVSWCADQCGYVESELFTKTASCGTLLRWFRTHTDKGQTHDASGYTPKKGDLAFNVSGN